MFNINLGGNCKKHDFNAKKLFKLKKNMKYSRVNFNLGVIFDI